MKLAVRALTTLMLLAASASGQSGAAVTAAREIAVQGLQAYEAGNYQEAVDKLARAYDVVKVPTLALYTARAHVKVGKLVEASEIYLQATRLAATGSDRAAQEQARQDAEQERAALMPRIPMLVVEIEGAAPNQVTVAIDGTPLAMSLLGVGHMVNPGTCKVEGKRGQQTVVQEIRLAEGERRSVMLSFVAGQDGAPPPPVQTQPAPPPASPPPGGIPPQTISSPQPEADAAPPGATQRTLGWVGLGIGGAGLVFGGVTGAMLASKRSKLDDGGCIESECYVDQSDDIDSYNAMRPLPTVGFIVGAVGVAAGLTLLLTAPEAEPASAPEVQAWLGVGSAGVAGRF